MIKQINLGDIIVNVELKDIKNIHLSVYPPTGQIRISAPKHMDLEKIRVYTVSKMEWINSQQKKYQSQERETPRDFTERESHYLWGDRFLLHIIENSLCSIH